MVTAQSNHTCQSFADSIILYLDGGLNQQEEQELLASIKNCPTCSDTYNKEKAIRASIRSKVSRKKVSPALIQSIKDKISHSSI